MAFQFVIVLVLLLMLDLMRFDHEHDYDREESFLPCAIHYPALTVPNLMRFDPRKAIAWFSAVTLIFWCSCERHHVGELPDEHATAETKPATEEHTTTDQSSPAMHDHSHMAGTPEPRNSPANFFPDKKKP